MATIWFLLYSFDPAHYFSGHLTNLLVVNLPVATDVDGGCPCRMLDRWTTSSWTLQMQGHDLVVLSVIKPAFIFIECSLYRAARPSYSFLPRVTDRRQ